jgi:hypothetical protein
MFRTNSLQPGSRTASGANISNADATIQSFTGTVASRLIARLIALNALTQTQPNAKLTRQAPTHPFAYQPTQAVPGPGVSIVGGKSCRCLLLIQPTDRRRAYASHAGVGSGMVCITLIATIEAPWYRWAQSSPSACCAACRRWRMRTVASSASSTGSWMTNRMR